MSPANAAATNKMTDKSDHAQDSAQQRSLSFNFNAAPDGDVCRVHVTAAKQKAVRYKTALATHNTLLELYCTSALSRVTTPPNILTNHTSRYYRNTSPDPHKNALLHRARAQ